MDLILGLYTGVLFFLDVVCQDRLFSIKVQMCLVILPIKNSSQYLRSLFCLFLDHNKSGLCGSNSDANTAYA